jgi:hypothetical protein
MKPRILEPLEQATQRKPVEVTVVVSDQAATAFAWGISLSALFASIALVLVAMFQGRNNERT